MLIDYEDHGINPVVLKIETGVWSTGVSISQGVGNSDYDTSYKFTKTFKSKDDATEYSIERGKKIIDDIIQGVSP